MEQGRGTDEDHASLDNYKKYVADDLLDEIEFGKEIFSKWTDGVGGSDGCVYALDGPGVYSGKTSDDTGKDCLVFACVREVLRWRDGTTNHSNQFVRDITWRIMCHIRWIMRNTSYLDDMYKDSLW